MSTFGSKKIVCALCGKESEFNIIMSTNEFGSRDLDTRPAEMRRSTMSLWVQECPECGYISSNVSDKTSINREYLNSVAYKTCDSTDFKSGLAQRFYKKYMINLVDNDVKGAFWASLHAAWASDDASDFNNAKQCRKKSLALIEKMEDYADKNMLYAMKADLLRRSDQFDEVVKLYEVSCVEDEHLDQIIKFEVERAKANDNKCYTIEDTLFDRTTTEKKGFFKRLFKKK